MDLLMMTPRQMVAGLMRGDARTHKQGYGPEAATYAAGDFHNLPTEERQLLLAYAQGFADGILEDSRYYNPGRRISEAASD